MAGFIPPNVIDGGGKCLFVLGDWSIFAIGVGFKLNFSLWILIVARTYARWPDVLGNSTKIIKVYLMVYNSFNHSLNSLGYLTSSLPKADCDCAVMQDTFARPIVSKH